MARSETCNSNCEENLSEIFQYVTDMSLSDLPRSMQSLLTAKKNMKNNDEKGFSFYRKFLLSTIQEGIWPWCAQRYVLK